MCVELWPNVISVQEIIQKITVENYSRGDVDGFACLHDALSLSPDANYCRSVDPLQVKAYVIDIHHLEHRRDYFHACFYCHSHPENLSYKVKEELIS